MKMVSLLILSLFFSCLTAASIDECVKGESYWCSRNAMRCSAVKHYVATVWKNDVQDKINVVGNHNSCKKLVNYIKQIVKDQATKESIRITLKEKLCKTFGEHESDCHTMVDQHTDDVIDLIESEINPDSFCQFFDIEDGEILQLLTLEEADIAETFDSTNLKCKVCKIMIKMLKKMIGKDPTKENVGKVLAKLCNMVPFPFGPVCKVIVKESWKLIEDLLLKKLDINKTCIKMHLCSALSYNDVDENTQEMSTLSKDADKEKVEEETNNCKFCIVIVTVLKKMIGENPTKEKVEEALKHVCNLMPKPFRPACKHIVKHYTPKLIELLLKKVDSDKICKEIHMCPSSTCPKVQGKTLSRCEVCKVTTLLAEHLIGSNTTVEMIESVVSKTCQLMPCQSRMECMNLIDEFGSLIVQYFTNHVKPSDMCIVLSLCNIPEHPRDNCLDGPQFWCSSPLNAVLCKAEDHCKKFVWA